jgi:hypothetical protein
MLSAAVLLVVQPVKGKIPTACRDVCIFGRSKGCGTRAWLARATAQRKKTANQWSPQAAPEMSQNLHKKSLFLNSSD